MCTVRGVWTVAGYVAGGWLEAGGRVLLFLEFVQLTCLAFHLISSSITTLPPNVVVQLS